MDYHLVLCSGRGDWLAGWLDIKGVIARRNLYLD